MATSLPIDLPANLKCILPYLEMATDYESIDLCISYWCRLYALKQGFILKRVEKDLLFLLDLMKVLGQNKQELQSKIEANDITVARAHLEGVVQKLLNWAEKAPPLVSFTDVVTKAFHSAGMLLDVCSIFGEPSEDQAEKKKCTDTANLHSEFHPKTLESTTKETNIQHQNVGIEREFGNAEKNKNGSLSTSTATNEAKSLKVIHENELRNHPASQNKPEGLPSLEIVQNKMRRNKMIADELLDFNEQQTQRPSAITNWFGDLSQTDCDNGRPSIGSNGAEQIPPRLPPISGFPGPTPPNRNARQQVPVAPKPTVTQLRESSVASWRARSSGLRIVDPNTNRDILTGKEVSPSAVATSVTATHLKTIYSVFD